MPKVLQIRDVPDDVHAALTAAAEAQHLSLAGYVRRELEQLARRAQAVQENAAVVRDTQATVRGRVDRRAILEALHEGRGD
ncbi:MAG: antitoxin [Acidimicrobiales bacterium]